MNSITAIHAADIARQRVQRDAAAARAFTNRHPSVPEVTGNSASRPRRWRVRWHQPARAGFVGS